VWILAPLRWFNCVLEWEGEANGGTPSAARETHALPTPN